MQTATPLIYVGRFDSPRLSWPRRIAAAISALACISLLITALSLKPSPTGMGTHHQLALDECGFLKSTSLPCPTCGMTTSFSHFVRGQVLGSLYVQPMGFILAFLTAGAFWACAYIAITGRPIHRMLAFIPAPWWILPLLGGTILAWGWKILIHIRGIDGWPR